MGAVLLLVTFINIYTYGVFFKPIADQFGWSRGDISGAFSGRMIVGALFVAVAGSWSDRFGPRRVVLPSLVILGVGILLMGRAPNFGHCTQRKV